MFGHEKITMNGGGGGSSSSAVSATIAAVAASQPIQSTSTTSTPTVAAGAGAVPTAEISTTTTVGAANSSASAGISNGMNGATQNANNHRGSDSNKRRKSKNRNSTVPTSSTYSRDHLDAWLETCLKDASSTQLSSSSEFLDYNPTSSFQSNKKTQPQQQTQQQQFLQQQLHQQQQAQQQQFQHDFQQQFGTKLRQLNYPAPFSQGFQKSVPTIFKNSLNNRFAFNPNNLLQHTDGSVEFASLPPIVNLLGSENENNSTDVLDGSSSNPNMSRGFRFSDPCLLNPSDNDSKVSGQETPDRRNYTNPTEMENNKFFSALMEQINMLHETNSKICRNLHETKVDIEALKHAPNWGMRHRRDSLSGLSTHSQPLGFGFGTQSPAPTYHSGAYTPGMMTDVVREVKEAARVREDALLSRVKAMVEERSWSMGESNLRMMREIEELKSQIQHLRTDRKDTNKRLAHLETENKYMRQMLASILNNRSSDIIYENETMRAQRKNNFQSSDVRQPKRANSLNLHYGVIHQAAEEEEPMNALHIGDQNSIGVTPMESSDHRNSFSSSDGQTSVVNSTSKNGWPEERSLKRIPKPAAVTEETMELRKELQEAIAARNQADNRIIALENMVKKLQVKLPNGGDERMMGVFGVNNHMTIGGSRNGGGGGIAAAPAYSFLTSSSSKSSSPTPKSIKSELSTPTTAPATALISSASSASQIFHINSSNQMNVAHQQQLQHQQQQHQQLQVQLQEHQQHQQQQQSQQSHLPPKLSLAGPITDL